MESGLEMGLLSRIFKHEYTETGGGVSGTDIPLLKQRLCPVTIKHPPRVHTFIVNGTLTTRFLPVSASLYW